MVKQWIEFYELGKKTKTSIYRVKSLCDGTALGVIKWYPQWRYYCFFPIMDWETVYSDRCLIEISNFITKLNKKHKSLSTQADKKSVS